MLEPAVEDFGGAVGGAGSVELGQHVLGAGVQRRAEFAQFDQGAGEALPQAVNCGVHEFFPVSGFGIAVGGDDR